MIIKIASDVKMSFLSDVLVQKKNLSESYQRPMINKNIQKVSLRPLNSAGIDNFMVWGTDLEVTRYVRWKPYQSRKEAEDFFAQVVEKHPWFQAIVLN